MLAPVRITARAHTIRNGHSSQREVWAAESPDGVWSYERIEVEGTPWKITHEPTGWWMLASSLPMARSMMADGTVATQFGIDLLYGLSNAIHANVDPTLRWTRRSA